MAVTDNLRILNQAGAVLYEGPYHGCRQHQPTDPPHPDCVDCKYKCLCCGKLQGSVRRWIDDIGDADICACGRSLTAMRFWRR